MRKWEEVRGPCTSGGRQSAREAPQPPTESAGGAQPPRLNSLPGGPCASPAPPRRSLRKREPLPSSRVRLGLSRGIESPGKDRVSFRGHPWRKGPGGGASTRRGDRPHGAVPRRLINVDSPAGSPAGQRGADTRGPRGPPCVPAEPPRTRCPRVAVGPPWGAPCPARPAPAGLKQTSSLF